MLSLLFNQTHQLLGEVITEQGALRQFVLNQQGETVLGTICEMWQTRGVPVRKELTVDKADGSREITFYLERVQARTPDFFAALSEWGEEHSIVVLSIQEKTIGLWEMLVQLPLDPSERFAFLIALKHTPPDLLGEWRKALEEAKTSVMKEQEKTNAAVEALQKQMAHHLNRPFAAAASAAA